MLKTLSTALTAAAFALPLLALPLLALPAHAASLAVPPSCQEDCEEVCELFFPRGTQQWAGCVINCVEYELCPGGNPGGATTVDAALAFLKSQDAVLFSAPMQDDADADEAGATPAPAA